MPYSDPEKQREAKRRWYREKYQSDPQFREDEAERKAEWIKDNALRKRYMRKYIREKRKDPEFLAKEAAQKREKYAEDKRKKED